MTEAKSIYSPIASVNENNKDENGSSVYAPYQEFIALLLFPANTVRPDISLAVGKLYRFC